MKTQLSFSIKKNPKGIQQEEVEPGKELAIQRADDEFLIICDRYPDIHYMLAETALLIMLFPLLILILKSAGSGSSGVSGGATMLFMLAVYVQVLKSRKAIRFMAPASLILALFCLDNASAPLLNLVLCLLLIAGFLYLYGYTMPKKEFIFDRQNGLFTYPGFMWGKAITLAFTELLASVVEIRGKGARCELDVRRRKGFASATLATTEPYKCSSLYETWSLYVWYMDKNRPLPPGTAFDPYRRKDREARKQAGKPAPLFKSLIPTPEFPRTSEKPKPEVPNQY